MFYYILKKEFKLIFRDIHALLVLFLMPSVFILIMSITLKNTYSQEIDFKFKVAVNSSKNKDIDTLVENLNQSQYFKAYLQEEKILLKDLIYKNKFDFIVILDENFKKRINKNDKNFSIQIYNKPDGKYEFYTILKSELVKIISKDITKEFFIQAKIDAKNLDNLDNLISFEIIFTSSLFKIV